MVPSSHREKATFFSWSPALVVVVVVVDPDTVEVAVEVTVAGGFVKVRGPLLPK